LKPDPNKLVHTFSVSDIEMVLSRYPKVATRRTFAAIFGIFFRWAIRHHYCLENPCERLDKLPKDMSQIAALSLDESKRLLRSSMDWRDGVTAPVVAIGLFAGLRPSEISDLKPEDILEDRIRVSGGKMRRKIKRVVPIVPVLAAWLKEYTFEGLPAGWNYKFKILKKATKAENWVQDIIRHTSITFQAERDQNEALTITNCGTSIDMMNRHYRVILDDAKAVQEFWELTPAKVRASKVVVDLPTKQGIDWPAKSKLKKLVWQKPLIHAAKELGVSDVALKKHCVKLGIELPPRGYWLRS
jgi:integrase